MWRLSYAMNGLSRPGNPHDKSWDLAFNNIHSSCEYASIILDDDNNSNNYYNNYRDACLVSASALPDGKFISLHIDGEKVELREAKLISPMSQIFRINGENKNLSLFSTNSKVMTNSNDIINTEERGEKTLIPLHTTTWRQVKSSNIVSEEENEPLQKLRYYSEFETTFSTLAADSVYQIDLESLEKINSFDFGRTAVNATALDYWGPNCILVGFSSSDLLVVDWRNPKGGPMIITQTPQPILNSRSIRGRIGFNTSCAGVMSCCCLEDNFRVICGLGDSLGTVVVTDLRRAFTASVDNRKRGRLSFEDELKQTIIAGRFSTPTNYPKCDMRHSRLQFGTIAMVDTGGTGVLTNVNDLESDLINEKNYKNKTLLQQKIRKPPIRDNNGNIIPHKCTMKCDVSLDGKFMVNTRLSPWSATISKNDGKETKIEIDTITQEKLDNESFLSISCMGSVICAHTKRGNSLCAIIPTN